MISAPRLPLVSILTPTYNRASFLTETIESVLGQDYPHIEYIVLDDGSQDNTHAVVQSYGSRVRYVHHENIGETRTVNKGLQLAEGEIVCVVNSDDPLFRRDAVRLAVDFLHSHPQALMAYPDWVSIDECGKVLREMRLPDYTFERMFTRRNVALGPGLFIRRSAIEIVGLRDESLRYTGDLDYSFRLAAAGEIVHIPYVLATHREHAAAASSSAKGRTMAHEVARLGEFYIKHPSLPAAIRAQRRRMLAKWHCEALFYAGGDHKAFLKHAWAALRNDCVVFAMKGLSFAALAAASGMKKLARCVFCR